MSEGWIYIDVLSVVILLLICLRVLVYWWEEKFGWADHDSRCSNCKCDSEGKVN